MSNVNNFRNKGVPYKTVYALIQQMGADSIQTVTSGSLDTIVTYKITNYQAGDDFTNIGAPSNANDVYFIPTGPTPANWSNGSELTYNQGAPLCGIIENTLGPIWFERNDVGIYYVKSNGLFINSEKTGIQATATVTPNIGLQSTAYWLDTIPMGDTSTIVIQTGIYELAVIGSVSIKMTLQDSVISPGGSEYAILEIKVYP